MRSAKIEENGAKQRRQVGETLPRRFGDMGHRVAEKEIRSEIDDEAEPEGREEVLNRNASNIDRRQQRRLAQDEPEQEHCHEARQEAYLQRGISKCNRQIGRLHQLNAPDPRACERMVIAHRIGAAEYGGNKAGQYQRCLAETDAAMLANGDAALHEEPDAKQADNDDF